MKHSRSPLGLQSSHNLRRVNRHRNWFGPLHPVAKVIIAGYNVGEICYFPMPFLFDIVLVRT